MPAFVGLGAPYWDPYARGCLTGLTRGANRCHIVRAAVESMAYQTYDVLHAMEQDAGIPLAELRVDGGAAANSFLLQFQSDITGVPVLRPSTLETTALGAAYLAGLAVGYWADLSEIRRNWQVSAAFSPAAESEKIQGKAGRLASCGQTGKALQMRQNNYILLKYAVYIDFNHQI